MSADIYSDEIKKLANACSDTDVLEKPFMMIELDNPFCGDRVRLKLKLEGDRLIGVSHEVKGCLLCRASASVLEQSAQGCSHDDAKHMLARLTAMLEGEGVEWSADWQALALFQGVSVHKMRHGCVLLPFKALLKGIAEGAHIKIDRSLQI